MNELRETLYYIVRLPTALFATFLVFMGLYSVVMPDFAEADEIPMTMGLRLTISVATLIPGVFILFPNYRFSSPKAFRFRFVAMAILGLIFAGLAFSITLDYFRAGKSSLALVFAAVLLYNAVALPISVWMRKRLPDA